MEFRPCIDLHGGQVKQIVGSSLTDDDRTVKTNFVSSQSPAYFAELYKRDSLTGGHVIMLGTGNETAARKALSAYPGGLQVGGGITAENAEAWLDAGASQVILTSYIFSGGELNQSNLKRIFKLLGRERLVLDLSCRSKDGEYYIVTDRWQRFTNWKVNSDTLKFMADFCCEFLIHAVDVEGKQAGIDEKLLEIMAEHSPITSVYAGGIRSLDDIRLVTEKGRGRVAFTIGSALDIFGGKLKYREVVEFTRSRQAGL
jgi:phosphoribosylformimino-5-aminoimidazole carboxamide ribotide isomerase